MKRAVAILLTAAISFTIPHVHGAPGKAGLTAESARGIENKGGLRLLSKQQGAVTVDGDDSDWSVENIIAQGTGSIADLSAQTDGEYLYLLLRGESLSGSIWRNQFYIDTRDDAGGFGLWSATTAEYLLEGDNLYAYTGQGGSHWSWGWLETLALANYVCTSSVIELRIRWAALGTEGKKNIRVGYTDRDGAFEYAPAITEPMASIFPCLFSSIPNAVGLAIDDTGWMYWGGAQYPRNYTIDDYQTIVDIGKNTGTRIMTAWILSDLDKTGATVNPAYNPPYTESYMTGHGLIHNPPDIAAADALMDFVKNNAEYMEFGFHGIAHEYYYYDQSLGRITSQRAEWAQKSDTPGISSPWSWEDLNLKMQCALEIIRQYFDEETSSFPKSFVAPAHGYYYGDGSSPHTTGALMRSFGVKYGNGDVNDSTQMQKGGIDHGLLYIDRAFGAPYDAVGQTPWDNPAYPKPRYLDNSITAGYGWTEAHFPNVWGAEAQWTEYLSGLNNHPDRYLPANTAQGSSQWLYRHYASIAPSEEEAGQMVIDTRDIPDDAYTYDLLSTLVLKTRLGGRHVSQASIDNGAQILGYYEDEYDYGYLIIGHKDNPMGRLSKGFYHLQAALGDSLMPAYIDYSQKTYLPFSFTYNDHEAQIRLEMYGKQQVRVSLPFEPLEVKSDNNNLNVASWEYSAPFLTMTVEGKNIQGEAGALSILSQPSAGSMGDLAFEELRAWVQDGGVAVSAQITNNRPYPVCASVLTALYESGTNRLIQLEASRVRVGGKGSAPIEKRLSGTAAGGAYVKLLAWRTDGAAYPLAMPAYSEVSAALRP